MFILEHRFQICAVLESFLELMFGSRWPPKMRPFRQILGAQHRSTNRSEIGLLKRSLQDRHQTARDPPKTHPGSPPRSLPGFSRTPSGAQKKLFRSTWPNMMLAEKQTNRIYRNLFKNKSTMLTRNSHSTQSLANIEIRSQRANERVAAVVARSALQ